MTTFYHARDQPWLFSFFFKDSSHIVHCFEISKELFNLLDSFELDDLSFLNEWDRYLEQSMQTEASMETRSICHQETVEETVFRHIESEMLHNLNLLYSRNKGGLDSPI